MHTTRHKNLVASLLPIISVVAICVGAILARLYSLPEDSTTTIATVANAANPEGDVDYFSNSKLEYVSSSHLLGVHLGDTEAVVESAGMKTNVFNSVEIKLDGSENVVRNTQVRVNLRESKVHSVDVVFASGEWTWDDIMVFTVGFFPPTDWVEDQSKSTWNSEEGRISNEGFSALRSFNGASGKELLIISHRRMVTADESPSTQGDCYRVTWSMAR